MEEFDKLKQYDDQIFKIFQENFGKLSDDVRTKSQYKSAIAVFTVFLMKSDFLKLGMIDLVGSLNIYSSKVIFRTLIEHYLKFLYIYLRTVEEKSDAISKEYLDLSVLNEEVETLNAWKSVVEILGIKNEKNHFENVKQKFPEYKDCDSKILKQKILQFKHRNIIKYLNSKLNKKNSFEGGAAFALKLIPQYSELSSFIHGGAGALENIFQNMKENDRAKEMSNDLSIALMISASIKMFYFLFLFQFDKNFGDAYIQIRELSKEFSSDTIN